MLESSFELVRYQNLVLHKYPCCLCVQVDSIHEVRYSTLYKSVENKIYYIRNCYDIFINTSCAYQFGSA
jgi:hypothetical protein